MDERPLEEYCYIDVELLQIQLFVCVGRGGLCAGIIERMSSSQYIILFDD